MSGDDFLSDALLEEFISTHLDSTCNDSPVAGARVPQAGLEHSRKPKKTLNLEELKAERDKLLGLVAVYDKRMEMLKDVLAQQQSDISSIREERRKYMELKREFEEVKAQVQIEEEKKKTLMGQVKFDSRDDYKKREAAYKDELTVRKKNIRKLKIENKTPEKKRAKELKEFVEYCEYLKEKDAFNKEYEETYLRWKTEYEQRTNNEDK